MQRAGRELKGKETDVIFNEHLQLVFAVAVVFNELKWLLQITCVSVSQLQVRVKEGGEEEG